MNLKLNCDMGEGFGVYSMPFDEKIMPYIDIANLACGFHASDPLTMQKSIQLCKEHNVEISAHPSYPDLVGFGRREMACSSEEIEAFVLYQIGALSALCKSHNMEIKYIKPHGALYNSMMRDKDIFRAIVKAVAKFDTTVKLMILSSSQNNAYAKMAKEYRVGMLYEVFADRAYTNEGTLVSRLEKNAVINDKKRLKERAKLLIKKGVIKSIEGKKLKLQADTLCVHGDNESALKLIKSLYKIIK